jgi:hypothetical protein
MKNSITIISWLRKNSDYESSRRVTVRRPRKVVSTSKKMIRRVIWKGRLNGRGRWLILGRWSIRQMCSTTTVDLCHQRLHRVV